jgi:hypothetical protein
VLNCRGSSAQGTGHIAGKKGKGKVGVRLTKVICGARIFYSTHVAGRQKVSIFSSSTATAAPPIVQACNAYLNIVDGAVDHVWF